MPHESHHWLGGECHRVSVFEVPSVLQTVLIQDTEIEEWFDAFDIPFQ
jgi:hypothetical protein